MRISGKLTAALFLCLGLLGCTNDTFVEEPSSVGGGNGATIKEITVTLPQIEGSEEFATTRTEFVMDADGVKAHWAAGDTIGIFPAKGDQVSFPITGGTETNTATFDGGDWGLKAGRSYAAYFPYSKWNTFRTNETVLMDYTGQVQTGNNNYAHLGAYDFLAAGQVNPNSAGYLTLDMQRLGSIVMLQLTLPDACTPTEIVLTSDRNNFVTKAELDVSSSSPVVSMKKESSTFTLGLENVSLTSANQNLTAYLMLSPVAFKTGGSTWSVRVNAADGRYYIGEIETKDLEANKPYKFVAELQPALPTLRNANLIAAAEASAGQTFTKNDDGTVTLNEANMAIVEAVTTLDLSGKGDPTICDGIEYFVNLKRLYCGNNLLTTLDISKNTYLKSLSCSSNQLSFLDVSKNTVLDFLQCSGNQLTSLDVSMNLALTSLQCNSNHLSSLDLSKNTVLNYLSCTDNQLTSLNVSNNTLLKTLQCFSNQLSSLDVSKNTNLDYLSCSDNQLSSLDVSMNLALTSLQCNSNLLTSLDVSNNIVLDYFSCASNLLTSLDVSNNTALVFLQCNVNQLTSIDVSNNSVLRTLSCPANQLTSLDVSNNTALTDLWCSYNQLTSMDVSNNTALTALRCSYNQLISLDVSNNLELDLSNVQVGNQPVELTLYVNGTQSSQTLASVHNDNVTIVLKDDGGATNPDPGDWN